eukprot:scaffold126114_cov27-Phaeocystis_antarctica.AAC.1
MPNTNPNPHQGGRRDGRARTDGQHARPRGCLDHGHLAHGHHRLRPRHHLLAPRPTGLLRLRRLRRARRLPAADLILLRLDGNPRTLPLTLTPNPNP